MIDVVSTIHKKMDMAIMHWKRHWLIFRKSKYETIGRNPCDFTEVWYQSVTWQL